MEYTFFVVTCWLLLHIMYHINMHNVLVKVLVYMPLIVICTYRYG